MAVVDYEQSRYPFCIVWTPIPLLTWLFPAIGHMGIAYSNGAIRDFAGPYHVSVSSVPSGLSGSLIAKFQEDNMAFGTPTRYLQLDVTKVDGGPDAWDRAVRDASEEYKGRMHNLCCDNCHSHVSMALNLMRYDGSSSYNMGKLAAWSFFAAKYVGVSGFLKTWSPFLVLVISVILFATLL